MARVVHGVAMLCCGCTVACWRLRQRLSDTISHPVYKKAMHEKLNHTVLNEKRTRRSVEEGNTCPVRESWSFEDFDNYWCHIECIYNCNGNIGGTGGTLAFLEQNGRRWLTLLGAPPYQIVPPVAKFMWSECDKTFRVHGPFADHQPLYLLANHRPGNFLALWDHGQPATLYQMHRIPLHCKGLFQLRTKNFYVGLYGKWFSAWAKAQASVFRYSDCETAGSDGRSVSASATSVHGQLLDTAVGARTHYGSSTYNWSFHEYDSRWCRLVYSVGCPSTARTHQYLIGDRRGMPGSQPTDFEGNDTTPHRMRVKYFQWHSKRGTLLACDRATYLARRSPQLVIFDGNGWLKFSRKRSWRAFGASPRFVRVQSPCPGQFRIKEHGGAHIAGVEGNYLQVSRRESQGYFGFMNCISSLKDASE